MALLQNHFCNEISEIIQNPKIKIIDNLNISKKPVTPNKKIWIASGILIGIFAGMILVYVLEIRRDRFKSKKIIEDRLSIPVIGVLTHKNNMEG